MQKKNASRRCYSKIWGEPVHLILKDIRLVIACQASRPRADIKITELMRLFIWGLHCQLHCKWNLMRNSLCNRPPAMTLSNQTLFGENILYSNVYRSSLHYRNVKTSSNMVCKLDLRRKFQYNCENLVWKWQTHVEKGLGFICRSLLWK